MSLRIEYAGVPLTDMDGKVLTFAEGTSIHDVIESLPGRITVRPPTPWEAVCDRIRTANGFAARSVLLPALRPESPEWDE